ncbi:hypothetical protein LJC53_01945 [Bacteroidales bacterium OttesenSCG-928-C03]|nr:hypothetical protein [Bacteroidales bacterium OttesenSCG-928-C03]MDL2326341.1 hypothetical protein [Bacteroidales bacterium OttesenSCG-928-A14]
MTSSKKNNIFSNQANHFTFTKSEQNVEDYLKMVAARKVDSCKIAKRIEPRTRKQDYANALSFEVFDPLWMLSRQWQFGRFNGNDCGTAVTAKIKTSKKRLDCLYPNRDMDACKEYSTHTPMEYEVEKMNKPITFFIRIESALYFKKLVENRLLEDGCEEYRKDLFTQLMALFPLDPLPDIIGKERDIETLKTEQNSNLKRMYAMYGKRIFDGYKLFKNSGQEILKNLQYSPLWSSLHVILDEYNAWFTKKYQPVEYVEDNCWNEQKLGYETAMGENANIYEAEDYHTGRLSWYSFDAVGNFSKNGVREEKLFSYLPVPASFPGAPNRRLWEFEDKGVQFGHQANDDFSLLANAVVMQYVSMYGNDWMITPIEAEVGTVLNVEGIIVLDTFGERIFIDTSAEETDNLGRDVSFIDRWSLFGTTRVDAYETMDFMPQGGLLFPPTVRRTEESKPIEEVQFLRDEMANMLWGVETIINDGCDGTLDGKELSDAVLDVVDAQKKEMVDHEDEYDYSFLVQNRVPINWIPFIPQQIEGEIREICFRRGRMPIYYNGDYRPVRPSTELLKYAKTHLRKPLRSHSSGYIPVKRKAGAPQISILQLFPGSNMLEYDKRKDNADTTKLIPRFIHEEEINGYGIKLITTAQRTRWFLGESFTWLGAKKVVSQYQANSGLMFDELIEKKDTNPVKDENIEEE